MPSPARKTGLPRSKRGKKKAGFSRIAVVADDDDDGSDGGQQPPQRKEINFKAEASLFCNLAAPNVIIQVFSFALWMENSMYVGRMLGTVELAAVSLGNLTGT